LGNPSFITGARGAIYATAKKGFVMTGGWRTRVPKKHIKKSPSSENKTKRRPKGWGEKGGGIGIMSEFKKWYWWEHCKRETVGEEGGK